MYTNKYKYRQGSQEPVYNLKKKYEDTAGCKG